VLLDGKPHDVIARYLSEVNPSLLILGTTGIHADADLDIGGNTEQLLSDVSCSVLLSQHEHRPQVDRLASVSTSWTTEAETRMERVPSFVRSMAKMAILRYAQEHGHTVITESIVDEATAQLMPGHAEEAMGEIVGAYERGELKRKPDAEQAMRWSEQATALLLTIKDLSLRGNLSMRAEKKARAVNLWVVEAEHIQAFLDGNIKTGEFNPGAEAATLPGNGITETADESKRETLNWQAAALARLMRVPEGFMRDSSKQRIEDYARANAHSEISLTVAEAGLAEARKTMESAMQDGSGSPGQATPTAEPKKKSGCPFANTMPSQEEKIPETETASTWSAEAETVLSNVPAGFCRDMTRKAAETIAKQNGLEQVDAAFVGQVMETFKSGSESSSETMPWNEAARERIGKAPDMVRGMLIQEIEGWSQRKGLESVSEEAVDAIKQIWAERGVFHLDPNDPRNQ
ncbi:MAG: hypothetical protein ABW185_00720, partial [Sedimenticola sp.]